MDIRHDSRVWADRAKWVFQWNVLRKMPAAKSGTTPTFRCNRIGRRGSALVSRGIRVEGHQAHSPEDDEMSGTSWNRLFVATCLAAGFGWSAGVAADKPVEKAGPCPHCAKVQAAPKPPAEKGCCGKCRAEQAPAPKPEAKPQDTPPVGRGGRDAAFVTDRDTFHFLLENHAAIKRTVKKLDNGVETVTESDKPEVAKKIQEHVPAMYERLKSGNGVRYWDPLFAETFKHGKKMKMTIENTRTGVKVVETSSEAEVVKVIQAHADVVSKFVEKGFAEARQEHPVPKPEKKK